MIDYIIFWTIYLLDMALNFMKKLYILVFLWVLNELLLIQNFLVFCIGNFMLSCSDNNQTQNKAQRLAACGHVSASSKSLCFILSLRLYSSFITSRPDVIEAFNSTLRYQNVDELLDTGNRYFEQMVRQIYSAEL